MRPEGRDRPEMALRVAHIESSRALRKHRRSALVQRSNDVGACRDAFSYRRWTSSLSVAASAIDAIPATDQGLLTGGRLDTKTTPVRQTNGAKATFPLVVAIHRRCAQAKNVAEPLDGSVGIGVINGWRQCW